jgi:hypothetical protein
MATDMPFSLDNGKILLTIVPIAVLGGLLLLRNAGGPALDPREPPVLQSRIPFIGHIIGMVAEGTLYFKKLGWVIIQSARY